MLAQSILSLCMYVCLYIATHILPFTDGKKGRDKISKTTPTTKKWKLIVNVQEDEDK